MLISKIKNDNILSLQRVTGLLSTLPPNQRLKLTEKAVSFAPHEKAVLMELASSAARIVYMELAVRRRSLSAVR